MKGINIRKELAVGQKVYCFGGMGLPRGMYTVEQLQRDDGNPIIVRNNTDNYTYPVGRNEVMDEKDAIAHAYEIFKGFTV